MKTDFRRTEDRCIANAARCANNCPNGAMKIEDRDGEQILSLCGTILNRQKLLHCEICGAIMGPRRYVEYIRRRISPAGAKTEQRMICDACLRKKNRSIQCGNHAALNPITRYGAEPLKNALQGRAS
ncbi:MAG: hypothetical protein R2941_21715 [Desulfobacterales bacterium]